MTAIRFGGLTRRLTLKTKNKMPSFNKVILAGNLTREPETRYTPKGTAICQIGLAVNRVWTSESGEKKEAVTFVDCKAFGKSAETLAQYVKKGHPLLVEGRLHLEQWEDKETEEPRQKLSVVIESFQFLKGADKGATKPAAAPAQPSGASGASGVPGDGDDVPF